MQGWSPTQSALRLKNQSRRPVKGSATGRFPPETSDTIGRLWRLAIGELIAPAPTPTTTSRRSRVVKTQNTPSGTSNDPVTIGRNPTDHPTQAIVIYLNGRP